MPMPGSDTVTYRLLCPGNRTGSIIGKVQVTVLSQSGLYHYILSTKVCAGGRDHQATETGN